MQAQPGRRLLAADVGGTKTLLLLCTRDNDGRLRRLFERRYESGAFDSLEAMVERFMQQSGQPAPDSACFAVAGPLQQHPGCQSARLTNLPWQLDTRQLQAALGIPRVHLLNDFQAIGYSIDELPPASLQPLQTGAAHDGGPRLVVGAGTGLGVCIQFRDNGRYVSYPSEGGHIAFAPRDRQQQALLQFLRQEYPRVSCERLVSGAGLLNIYRYLLQREGIDDDPLTGEADPAAAIGEQALKAGDSLAGEAVRLFCEIYGAFAGDLALGIIPTGGVYIAGGIAPKLLAYLQEGGFMRAFLDKGRMRELVEHLPVQVITDPHCGLLGAAHYAARL